VDLRSPSPAEIDSYDWRKSRGSDPHHVTYRRLVDVDQSQQASVRVQFGDVAGVELDEDGVVVDACSSLSPHGVSIDAPLDKACAPSRAH
jgi:hypothetical protein